MTLKNENIEIESTEKNYLSYNEQHKLQIEILEKELSDIKKSFSFRLGWFLTKPMRLIYNRVSFSGSKTTKTRLFINLFFTSIQHPFKFFKIINKKNIRILIFALKHESPRNIYYNILKKASIEGSQNTQQIEQQIILKSIQTSGYFDEAFYCAQFPKKFFSNIDPLTYYFENGAYESKDPSEKFNTDFYSTANPDVAYEKINPLVHFLKFGKYEGRQTLPKTSIRNSTLNEKRERFTSNKTILFISHDANIAGAEVLFLDLLEWFYKNTTFNIKIISLEGGVLLQQFERIAPVLIWDDLKYINDDKKIAKIISEFCPKTDLIYGNTVLATTIYKKLTFLNAPIITHIHELEKTIAQFNNEKRGINLNEFNQKFIACSPSVSENLSENHSIKKTDITTINSFIKISTPFNSLTNSIAIREKLEIASNTFVVWGCGTIYWRKGVDFFIETAIKLKQKGVENVLFCWIGKDFWDQSNIDNVYPSWSELLYKIGKAGLNNKIKFLGEINNASTYFESGDIFFLPSREDPFPLVCLEAANYALPIICFEDSGGMPDFVAHDAGFVVPMGNTTVAAEKIATLVETPSLVETLGKNAQQKVIQNYSLDSGAKRIFELCKTITNSQPTVSVVVPNYNYAQFLDKRIESILNQTFIDYEIIILDDYSSDNSLTVINKYSSLPNVSIAINDKNSGNVFSQWAKGIEMAKGEFVWIAEADDFCESNFLSKLIPFFNDKEVAIAYGNSNRVNEEEQVIGDYDSYYADLDTNHWADDYCTNIIDEINFGLGVKNTIVNASAVVFRKEFIKNEALEIAKRFKFSGDWSMSLTVAKGHKIAFSSSIINHHRIHSSTITQSVHTEKTGETIIFELAEIHSYVFKNFTQSEAYLARWEKYVAAQIQNLIKDAANLDNYYPYSEFKNKLIRSIENGKTTKYAVFVTNSFGLSGAPQNVLRIAQMFHEKYNYYCITLSLEDGVLKNEFKQLGEAYCVEYDQIIEKGYAISKFLSKFQHKIEFAFVNTITSCQIIPELKKSNLPVFTALHDYTYAFNHKFIEMVYEESDHIIYSVEFMLKQNLKDYPSLNLDKVSIIPQGLYREELLSIDNRDSIRTKFRRELGIPNDAFVVFGCGTIHPIKGVDVFIETAINVITTSNAKSKFHFVWLGGELKSNSPDMYNRFLHRDIVYSETAQNIHFVDKTDDVKNFYAISDLFFLSSREDPFPSVVLEAFASEVPVIAIAEATGSTELIRECDNFLVSYSNRSMLHETIIKLSESPDILKVSAMKGNEIIRQEYKFSDYVEKLENTIRQKITIKNKQ